MGLLSSFNFGAQEWKPLTISPNPRLDWFKNLKCSHPGNCSFSNMVEV